MTRRRITDSLLSSSLDIFVIEEVLTKDRSKSSTHKLENWSTAFIRISARGACLIFVRFRGRSFGEGRLLNFHHFSGDLLPVCYTTKCNMKILPNKTFLNKFYAETYRV